MWLSSTRAKYMEAAKNLGKFFKGKLFYTLQNESMQIFTQDGFQDKKYKVRWKITWNKQL